MERTGFQWLIIRLITTIRIFPASHANPTQQLHTDTRRQLYPNTGRQFYALHKQD